VSTRLILVASFGQKAADVAQAKFRGVRVRTSYQYTPLTLMAGNLALKSYGPSDEDAFIHIPLIHPPRFNYSRQTPVELRFFYISMQFTFFVASQAMNVLKEHVAMGSTASRKMLCLDIIQEIARVLKTKDGLTFTSNMQQARFELNQHWGTLDPAEAGCIRVHKLTPYRWGTQSHESRERVVLSFSSTILYITDLAGALIHGILTGSIRAATSAAIMILIFQIQYVLKLFLYISIS
jgi:hypothetical protein